MDEAPPPLDPREEFFELVSSVRALVGFHEMTGAWGLPLHGPGGPSVVEEAPAAQAPVMPTTPTPSAPEQGRSYAAAPGPGRAFVAPTFAMPQAPVAAPVQQASPARAPSLRAEMLTPEARVERLHLLQAEVAGCTRCGLSVTRTNTVFARGNPLSDLCFVGEGPGFDEDLSGEPFVGPAGQLLDKMIVAMGYRRDEVYICNIVKCRPPENRKPDPDEMEACRGYLVTQLELVRPKFIVALGATAIQGLLGTTEGITRLRGKWKMYKGVPVMPTFHPAYLLRQPTAKRDTWTDLQEVMARLGKKPPVRA